MEMSLCRGISDPDIFYSKDRHEQAGAKRLCAACPTYAECLLYSLTRREPFGIWGGLNEKERMAAIRALQNGSDPVPVLLDPPKV
jgi:WhiB family redox-sensing transcriptional regulator